MRLGLLGGTFDPIHLGHLDLARAARAALDLDEVWIVPARKPPHRTAPHASAAHRFAMAALAIDDEIGFRMSDLDMDTAGPSYTIDTLDRLAAAGWQPGDLFFITGVDAFRDVPSWKAYPALLDRCHFVVISRPGAGVAQVKAAMPALAPRMVVPPCTTPPGPSIFLVDAQTAPVSSTAVRQVLGAGGSLDALIPPRVAAYIARHGLYSADRVESRKGHA